MRTQTARKGSQIRAQRGFTLMELMVVLAIVGVVMGLAVPNFGIYIRNSRLTGAANDLLSSLTMARSEAIKRQVPVAVCATADPNEATPDCSGGPFTAWVVWVDADNDWVPDNNADEPVLERHTALDDSLTVQSDNDGRIKYLFTGFAAPVSGGVTPTANVAMCDDRGTGLTVAGVSAARAIRIAATGRARVTKDKTEVETALAAIGEDCP
jgi:type IV fimbrial biogenesis protein FimT